MDFRALHARSHAVGGSLTGAEMRACKLNPSFSHVIANDVRKFPRGLQ